MSEAVQTITRREFIARFMRQCGLTYGDACRVYRCMVGLFEDGVINGSRICVGHVGALRPVWKRPREVTMPFKVTRDRQLVRTRRTYTLGGRYTFKFVLYDAFVQKHSLRWFVDTDTDSTP